ncbi:MAG: ParB N-terminal domain-containing protein [Pseudomonadota bacterium]
MAKRRRLSPAQSGFLGPDAEDGQGARVAPPPISRIAGDASTAAALAELSEEMRAARDGGRMVISVPLDDIAADHLSRDRLGADEEELTALAESLRARGQQMPLDVMEVGEGRYGLISGWRRLTALRRLHAETGEARFGAALCLLRQPTNASDAYVAMVEENELRVNLSYYERASIVDRAVSNGVYASDGEALRTLFSGASRAKRSKIGSFLRLVRALGGTLQHGAAIPERLGLQIAKRLSDDPGAAERMIAAVAKAAPKDAAGELAVLTEQSAEVSRAKPERRETKRRAADPVHLEVSQDGGLCLTGPGVDEAFERALRRWLAVRGH